MKEKKILICLVLLVFVYFVYKNITGSVFFKDDDRVNIVFHTQYSRFYSLSGFDLDYFIGFPADIKTLVPGGYGIYRIGALNKLSYLEKDPELIKKAFSAATSSMVDLYFYPREESIFYENQSERTIGEGFFDMLFSKGNANFVDRIMVAFKLLGKNSGFFRKIETGNDFTREEFAKKNIGIFFNRNYRHDRLNVQIIYSKSYKTALLISEILEGEGIRVVDLSGKQKASSGKCLIKTARENMNSRIVRSLSKYFNCNLKNDRAVVSDIIFELGSVEKDWLVN